MSATEAGLAAAWVVLNAGGPENSETQINDMMMISKQISTSFSMMSSLAAVPKSSGSDLRPCSFVCGGRHKVHAENIQIFQRYRDLLWGLNEPV
jgi:hypothetical protein